MEIGRKTLHKYYSLMVGAAYTGVIVFNSAKK